MRILVAIVSLSVAVSGCMSLRHEPRTVAMCKRGFQQDPDWKRASTWRHRVRVLRQRFASFDTGAATPRMVKSTTLWFRKPEHGEFASCSRERCESDRCFWRVQIYSLKERDWHVKSEYFLADRQKQ
jgi:hypothetical protein